MTTPPKGYAIAPAGSFATVPQGALFAPESDASFAPSQNIGYTPSPLGTYAIPITKDDRGELEAMTMQSLKAENEALMARIRQLEESVTVSDYVSNQKQERINQQAKTIASLIKVITE